MFLQRIVTRHLTFAMPGKLRNARRQWSTKDILLVFIETDAGLVGIGEGWTSYGSPKALAATIEDDIAPMVIGSALEDTSDLAERCRQACVMSGRYGITAVALSAVEMALWDLRAKAKKQPLYQVLGGKSPKVPLYASGGLYGEGKSPEDLGREMAGFVADGFSAVKLKVGGASLEEDVVRVAAARAAIGPDIALMVDAHYTMTRMEAIRFAEAVTRYDVGWLEAPILPNDYAGYAWLAQRSPVPLCGNETMPWREPFEALALAGVDYLMPDVSACGGISETLAISEIAATTMKKMTLHSSSSVVLFLASLHVAAAMKNIHSVEYHAMHRWLYDRAAGAFSVTAGWAALSERPGLGVDFLPDDFPA